MNHPDRQPAPVLHRIICRHYDRGSVAAGVVVFNADGTFTEVEPIVARAMSLEELGRALLEENNPPTR